MAVKKSSCGSFQKYSEKIFIAVLLISGLLALTLTGAIASHKQIKSEQISANTANPTIGQCPIYPADNTWNTDISNYPVHPNSDNYVSFIDGGNNPNVHPDFGTVYQGIPIGIPFNIVNGTQAKVNVIFDFADESDPGPYPIPAHPKVEGLPDGTDVGPSNCNGDCHLLMLDQDNCLLYELYAVSRDSSGNWHAGSGAIFNLATNDLRPIGWTSADAAGLAILPGLIKYDEFAAGQINHALRFTVQQTQKAYILPATHYASNITNANAPPMGLRFRLKASYDISGFDPRIQNILIALKTYGLIVADNGSNWYISGAPDSRWDDDLLHTLTQVHGSDFEAVYTGDPITSNPNTFTPSISGFSPATGATGANVFISGENLMGATSVLFNGTSASFSNIGATILSAKVPSNATSGLLSMMSDNGAASSANMFTVVTTKPPTITSFTPTSGPIGSNVTITGTGLSDVTAVTINSIEVSNITINSATSITVTVPAGASTGKIHVTNPANNVYSATNFTIVPSVVSFAPTSAIPGSSVTITGTSLTGTTAVKFGGIAATTFSVNSDSQIVATVPATAMSGSISVTTPSGSASSSAAFTVIKPPTISSLSPTSGAVGSKVTINGSNFGGTTAVSFNGVSASFTVTSNTMISATVPNGATTGKVSVTNPAGSATSATSFGIKPGISSFAPAAGLPNSSVVITGTSFTGATAVKFGTVSATFNVDADTQITATVPATASTGSISVTTAGGTATSATSFIVIKPPTISSFTPTSGAVGATVTINGTNLNSVTDVEFTAAAGTVNAGAITVVSATSIKVIAPGGAVTGKISVTNAAGTATSTATFKVLPKITSFAPAAGLPGSSVVITGTSFTGATAVKFGTVSATFNVDADTQITATVPATALTNKINVTTPSGTAMSATSFTVIKPPTITSFSPTSGKVGATVTINGTNLSSATNVLFNGTDAGAITVVSATQIKVIVPAGATTGKLMVTNPAGSANSTGTFTVTP
jgi:hypothetical protein